MESTATAASAAKTGTSRNTACRIADDDHPGGDPDTRLQPFRRGQRSNRLDQGEAGAHRAFGARLAKVRRANGGGAPSPAIDLMAALKRSLAREGT